MKTRVKTDLLLDLPTEMVSMIVAHMKWPELINCMASCKTLNTHCWNSWRCQSILLKQPNFATVEKFQTVFERYVFIWDVECIEIGINIVHNYTKLRRKKQEFIFASEVKDRAQRVRDVLYNAANFYERERSKIELRRHADLERRLSAIHTPVQAEFLLPNTGLTFRQTLHRIIGGYWVKYKEYNDSRTSCFINGKQPTDDN